MIDIDLTQLQPQPAPGNLARRIREKANARANFSLARGGEFISHETFWVSAGCESKERKISLTNPQGLFLYQLPFPNADFLSILDILHKAGLDENNTLEILDIVDVLEKHGVIESLAPIE